MMIQEQLKNAAKAAVKALFGVDAEDKMIQLQETRPEFEGQLTLVVFPFVKMARKSPEQVGQEMGSWLKENHAQLVSGFNVVKGFLNISIAPAAWVDFLMEIRKDGRYGFKPVTEQSPLVMIEYSSPNTNKPLHLGHVRNNLLGMGAGTGDDGSRMPCGQDQYC